MSNEIRNRIIRDATAEEKERHAVIRAEIEQELPALKDMGTGGGGSTYGSDCSGYRVHD